MSLVKGLELSCCSRRGGISRIWLVEKHRAPMLGYGLDQYEKVEYLGESFSSFPTHQFYNPHSGKIPSVGWFEFDFNRETAGFKADALTENGSTTVFTELEFYIPKITQKVQNRLNELIEACHVYALVELYDDDKCWTDGTFALDEFDNYTIPIMPTPLYFILGWDKIFEDKAFLSFDEGDQETGLDLQDANGTRVVLKGVGAEIPRSARVKINNNNTNANTTNTIDLWQPVTGAELTWFSN